jgi:hypothetical protein
MLFREAMRSPRQQFTAPLDLAKQDQVRRDIGFGVGDTHNAILASIRMLQLL